MLWSINNNSFLVKEHNILYDIEYVVKRTLALKNQQNEEKESSSIGIQVNFESYPVAFFKNRPLEKEIAQKGMSSSIFDKQIGVFKVKHIFWSDERVTQFSSISNIHHRHLYYKADTP